MVGQTLAHYKILEKIGSGGMGEVYLAEDTKLDRKVALKVLPPELAESEERRSRFQREAKAIAALNHPNIVQIYSVEEADGVHFITLELVKGKTLSELLPEQGFQLSKLFDIAIPLSDAVAAAHRQGILHRDLKPQNIIVSDEGRIKVVDFGLAKWTSTLGEEGSELPTVEKTTAGVIMGTLPYMSPEQAEGKSLDARSDVFSMGVVLYEMLTGRRPFGGDTPARIQASILRDEPPAIARGPEPLGKLVERCLAKEPSRRPQSALEVRNRLEEIRDHWRSGELQAPIGGRSSVKKWLALAMTALVSVALGIAFRPGRDADRVLRLVNPVQVTSAMGVEDDPTWSPDGGQLAYSSDRSGNPDIWVKHVERGEPVNRTADYEGLDCCPSWSPDGSELGFWSDRDGGGYFVMSAVGGAARRVINATRLRESSHFNAPQWSPDGSELAGMIVEDGKFFLEIQSTNRRQARRIALPGAGGARNDVTWSRDGRWFAFVDGGYFRDNLQLWLLRQEDGAAFAVTDGLTRVLSPSFSRDGRSLYYVSNRTGSMDLWQQKLGADGVLEGDPIPLTVGIGMRSAVLSPDGTKLAYSKGRLVANLWRVPVLENRSAVWADAEQLTFDEALVEFFDVSTDGRRLVFNSDRTGNMDLWVMPAEGGALSALTTGPELDWHPQWSPSGDEVAFYSLRSGRREIHVLPLDGGPGVQLTNGEAEGSESWFPAWSPDGSEITFGTLRDDAWSLRTIPREGGVPRLVHTEKDQLHPTWTPDGPGVLFPSADECLWQVPADGGEPVRVLCDVAGWPAVSLDGKRIFFTRGTEAGRDIWAFAPEDGTEQRLTQLEGRPGTLRTQIDTDGRFLYFGWQEDVGDLWVMDVVQEP